MKQTDTRGEGGGFIKNVWCGMWNVECGMWNVERIYNGLTPYQSSIVRVSHSGKLDVGAKEKRKVPHVPQRAHLILLGFPGTPPDHLAAVHAGLRFTRVAVPEPQCRPTHSHSFIRST